MSNADSELYLGILGGGIADGIALTEEKAVPTARDGRVWISGYGRERTTKSLKAGSATQNARVNADGIGAFERRGRYLMAWQFFHGVFWLSLAWSTTILSKILNPIGIKCRSLRMKPSAQLDRATKPDSKNQQTGSIDFWLLSDDGILSLPKDNNVDVEIETKKRLKIASDFWGEEEEQKLNNTLYGWWKNGGWWGEKDESGAYQESNVDEDTTSVISMSTNNDTASEWESEDEGARTPTQQYLRGRMPSLPDPPIDHGIDPTHLAQLLDPKTAEHKQEARMLAAHLNSDRILTRSQYQHDQRYEKAHVLTTTRYRPPGFLPSSPTGRLTPHEEAEVLEYLLTSRRAAASRSTASVGPAWRDGAEGLGAGGPQCVVCQSSPRTILSWPCRWLSLCEECRVSLAMNNFGTCVCCRTDVVGFSRLYVP